MRTVAVFVVLVMGLLLDAQGKKDTESEKKKLEGTWIAESIEKDGEGLPKKFVEKIKVVFTGAKVTFTEGDTTDEARYSLDTTTQPKRIDFAAKGNTSKGIYLIKDGTLKICIDPAENGSYPTEFVTKKGSMLALWVLKRQKP